MDTIPIDAMVYDRENKSLRAYNMKRGNGSYDAGKRRLIMNELVRSSMLLRSYGIGHGINPASARSQIIFYYGLRSIEPPLSLVGNELNSVFGFPVWDAIEVMNAYFREQLYNLIEAG